MHVVAAVVIVADVTVVSSGTLSVKHSLFLLVKCIRRYRKSRHCHIDGIVICIFV